MMAQLSIKAYRVAIVCGGAPLCVGSAIFILWLASGDFMLQVPGVLTILAGLALFAIGVVALAIACLLWLGSLVRRPSHPAHRYFPLRAFACAVLLCSNFPAAFGYMAFVAATEAGKFQFYRVVVRNLSDAPLERVRVSGAGCHMVFRSIASGESKMRRCWVLNEAAVQFSAKRGSTALTRVLLENHARYGGYAMVTVEMDGWVRVEDRGAGPQDYGSGDRSSAQ